MKFVMKSVAVGCLAVSAAPVESQLANASTAALGMGENYTAVARGYHAAAWNPAALGLSGNPEASGAMATFRVSGGLGPIGLRDLADHSDAVVPQAVKTEWLAAIAQAGGQDGVVGGDMTWGAVHRGRFALQVSSSARAGNDITPGVAELMLFGPLDENGDPKNLDVSGSSVDVNGYTSFALSYGMPVLVREDGSRLAIGVTATHTMGHVLAVSERSTGVVSPDSIAFAFPIAYTPVVQERREHQLQSGGGFGVDVAVAYETTRLTLAAVAQNVVNSFSWDQDKLLYRPAALVFSETEGQASFDPEPLDAAPAQLRARVAAAQFNPSWTLGASFRSSPRLTLAADARLGSTTGMATRAPVHAGAGAEYRVLRWLPVQLGASYVRTSPERDGMQLTAGFGIQRGGFTFGFSGARRDLGDRAESSLMVALVSHSFFGVGR